MSTNLLLFRLSWRLSLCLLCHFYAEANSDTTSAGFQMRFVSSVVGVQAGQ